MGEEAGKIFIIARIRSMETYTYFIGAVHTNLVSFPVSFLALLTAVKEHAAA